MAMKKEINKRKSNLGRDRNLGLLVEGKITLVVKLVWEHEVPKTAISGETL